MQPVNMNEVWRAIYYTKTYHGSQMRQSGVPYYSHPIEVAHMVAEYTGLEIPSLQEKERKSDSYLVKEELLK